MNELRLETHGAGKAHGVLDTCLELFRGLEVHLRVKLRFENPSKDIA